MGSIAKQALIEYIELLEGQEVLSTHYACCVGIVDGKVIAGGKVIDTLNTLQKAKRLFNELFENEGGASLL